MVPYSDAASEEFCDLVGDTRLTAEIADSGVHPEGCLDLSLVQTIHDVSTLIWMAVYLLLHAQVLPTS